ncbi:Nitrogen regulatory protein PII [Nitrosomonas sp. Nm51]|uniref:P-II family nitrogen regulator n=1 Tax=Nitrosomonas sp. Nm51 TaxID=133720 RepID=UPI0008AB8AE7|nr:transcriptional regulator [Nitrosomonas sp. Nm51]SER30289.1 Nitrogen regulatory protein PII [Nitrosomonas sp. Nm51]
MNSILSTKRIEIVIETEKLEELVSLLMEAGAKGYTVIKKAGGLGLRGLRNPDNALWDEGNVFVTLVCKEDQTVRIVQGLHPWLKKFGGMCLISDCVRLEVEGSAVS